LDLWDLKALCVSVELSLSESANFLSEADISKFAAWPSHQEATIKNASSLN
jgi:hypothetical protein